MTITTEQAEHGASTRMRPTGARVQSFGLGLAAATILLASAIATIMDPSSIGEVVAFFGPVAVVLLLAAWLAFRFGTWARIVGIVVAVLGGLVLFWTAFGLAAPDSFLDFLMGVGVPAGLLLGLGGGIVALVARRREHVRAGAAEVDATPVDATAADATTGERRLIQVVLGVVVVALAVSGVLTLLGRSTVNPTVAAGATAVDMADFRFVPAQIEVDASDPRLVVSNSDPFLHDLAVPALDALARVTPGSSALLDLSGAAPGTYVVYCTLHSDTSIDDPVEAGMAGTLVIR